ncbi:MAG: hypothetical protein JNN29_11970 [Chitinophagaceae bacterium]|nr:hypothetical protein [Chitinophagaceae bacterium]
MLTSSHQRPILSVALILITSYLFLTACERELSCEDCKVGNLPPVANAGHDLAISSPQDSILLDGRASTDPDGQIIRFKWTKVSGPASYSIQTDAQSTTRVRGLLIGSYNFELEVEDNEGQIDKDTIQVLVEEIATNHPPVAVAGADINIITPTNTVSLNGSASWDPDNNIAGYAWTKIAGPSIVTISDPVNVQTEAGNLVIGEYLFELVVTDAGGLFSKDTIKVTVSNPPGVPPVADAGTDQSIQYNLQTCSMDPSFITLDGTASFDPDGTIVAYQWTLISPANSLVNMTNPVTSTTTVSGLASGVYKFQLEVRDNDGGTDKDTVLVNVVSGNRQQIPAQLVPVGTLSQQRHVGAVATVGTKIFFAGGRFPPLSPGPNFSSRVDIYDISTNSWSTTELSQPRWGLTAVTSGNRVYFAGGTATQTQAGTTVSQTKRIDVYDNLTGLWSTMEMPRAGHFSSIAFGSKLFFAGGSAIDIYDVNDNAWTAKTLSQPRYLIATANVQGKLYFSGGASTISGTNPFAQIDIFDPSSGSWSVSAMSEPKYGIVSVGLRGKVMWAGGTTAGGVTNKVEMLDVNTQSTSFSCLFQPNSFSYQSLGKSNERLVFFVWNGTAKDRFDIYDVVNDSWSIGVLDQAITPSLLISVNNEIYVVGALAGGNGYYDQVWKLVF